VGREQESGHELGNLIVVHTVAVSVPSARLIVIVEEEIRLAIEGIEFDFIE
jgi:hypothetical protein